MIKQRHGYLILPRQSLLLLNDLGLCLYSFHEGLVMLTVWYRGNKDFGYITKNQTEIAKAIGRDQGTVSKHLKTLEKRKYLIRHKQRIKLKYFPLYLPDVGEKMHSMDFANLHELYVETHRLNAEVQERYELSQEKRSQNHPQRVNSSSKDNLSYFSFESQDIDLDDIPDDLGKEVN